MTKYEINLTDEEIKALEKLYDTDNLQETLQINAQITAKNYIRQHYKAAIGEKTLEELKVIFPNLKVDSTIGE